MDRLLDGGTTGPLFLKQPEIASIVAESILAGEKRFERYALHSYVVMPNHVHLLVTPRVTSRKWLGPPKGFTGHEANRVLGRSAPFWQDESYDHLVRDDTEFERIRTYIETNPVSAGLADLPELFPWSSASNKPTMITGLDG